MVHQRGDVFLALAQGGQRDFDHVQPGSRGLAELAFLNHLEQSALVAARIRTSTLTGSVAPRGVNSFSWMTRKQLDLRSSGPMVADLVEEDGAAVGHLEVALSWTARPLVNRAPDVSEQRGFQQLGGSEPLFTATKHVVGAWELAWMALAHQYPLPVPGLAKVMRMVERAVATLAHQVQHAHHAARSSR